MCLFSQNRFSFTWIYDYYNRILVHKKYTDSMWSTVSPLVKGWIYIFTSLIFLSLKCNWFLAPKVEDYSYGALNSNEEIWLKHKSQSENNLLPFSSYLRLPSLSANPLLQLKLYPPGVQWDEGSLVSELQPDWQAGSHFRSISLKVQASRN